jgi:hypothetical protein
LHCVVDGSEHGVPTVGGSAGHATLASLAAPLLELLLHCVRNIAPLVERANAPSVSASVLMSLVE